MLGRFQAIDEVVDGDNELRVAGSALPKSVLCVIEDIQSVQVCHDAAVYDVL